MKECLEWHFGSTSMNMTLTEQTRSPGRHTLPRLFVGPLPERVLLNAQQSVAKQAKGPRRLFSLNQRRSSSDNDEPVEELINHFAYAFHVKLGGSEGDWNEERENSVKYAMAQQWRESPWGRLWKGREDNPNASHARWVLPNDAGSFKVGDFLGLNTYAELPPRLTTGPICDSPTEESPSTSRQTLFDPDRPSAMTGDTNVTAHPPNRISPEPEPESALPQSSSFPESSDESTNGNLASTSTTGLLRVVPDADRQHGRYRSRTGPTDEVSKLKPALKARTLAPAESDGAVNGSTGTRLSSDRGKGKGKAKKVFVRLPHDPSPPGDVLQRTRSEVQETGAAAAEAFQVATTSSAVPLDAPDEYDDAKMRGENVFLCYLFGPISHPCGVPNSIFFWFLRSDRMVVRVAYCRDDHFGCHFDEIQDRSTRHMQHEDWAEFMVVWRRHRLELYNNFVRFTRLPCSASEP